jgi:SAM-dependent methyltransferase
MDGYGAETYGEKIAGLYDHLYPKVDPAMIDTLTRLAGTGPALELGIGTGRVALELAARGVEVHGVDASPAMVERLRAKPGGDRIPVTFGDFGEVKPDRRFSLVFVVFNTFFALLDQAAQVRCFANAAHALAPEGVFALEVFVPDVTRFDRGQRVGVTHIRRDDVLLDVSRHDPVTQQVTSQHLLFTGEVVRLYPVVLRYAWPAELDLMARLAGLRLRHRWSDWDGAALTARSEKHISIYERDPGDEE